MTTRRQQLTLFELTGCKVLRWRLTGPSGKPVLVYVMTERSAVLERIAWELKLFAQGLTLFWFQELLPTTLTEDANASACSAFVMGAPH